MSSHARTGRYGHRQNDGRKRKQIKALPLTPLDYALRIMRDETQPAALRASMAKAALPLLHGRGTAQEPVPEEKPEPMSDLELARRIQHILMRADQEQERQRAGAAVPPVPRDAVPHPHPGAAPFIGAAAAIAAMPPAPTRPPQTWPEEALRDESLHDEVWPDELRPRSKKLPVRANRRPPDDDGSGWR